MKHTHLVIALLKVSHLVPSGNENLEWDKVVCVRKGISDHGASPVQEVSVGRLAIPDRARPPGIHVRVQGGQNRILQRKLNVVKVADVGQEGHEAIFVDLKGKGSMWPQQDVYVLTKIVPYSLEKNLTLTSSVTSGLAMSSTSAGSLWSPEGTP